MKEYEEFPISIVIIFACPSQQLIILVDNSTFLEACWLLVYRSSIGNSGS